MRGRFLQSATVRAIMGTAALAALNGCATFGSNVKGSFSCTAPDGICAPSASIDDRALAMIAGHSGAADVSPAGPYMESKPRLKTARPAAVGQRLAIGQPDPRRTQERVLRIVFQPYIDEQGRLHEASAIHAVVQSGEWQQQALASASAIPDRNARSMVPAPESLAEAVDRADPANAEVSAIDPNLPDPAAIAAARARAADPVEAIKSEVAARLAPKTGRTPMPQAPADQARTTGRSVVGATATASAAGGKNASARPKADTIVAAPQPKITVGPEAATRVKASPEYRTAATQAEEAARAAAATAALPDAKSPVKATVRAAGFPAAVPEDN
ncbi:type IV conjugative transfer system lipoprotein TraV [Sphingobium limneticum]|uniref:type IV conjugative transfer system lipoprotein TraV n=1 Tax=Sphingobium limneticum TaxID=1007511 RepID=UPI003CFFF786